ncbi:MAG: AMP-binding protein [Desulfobacterales bacterium]|jgi:acyl-CoA synthetase (AMP-forming)/AMP-acid ligase II
MQVIDKTIADFLDEIAAENPQRDALIHSEMGVRYNFERLCGEIDRSARGFIKKGINAGDRVGLWAHNRPEWLLSFLGLTKIGAITVPIDPNATSENLHFILEQSESRGLIIAPDSDDKKFSEIALAVREEVPSLEFIFVFGDPPAEEMTTWAELQALAAEVDDVVLAEMAKAVHAEDPMAIMYTSGTTGQPKGVVLDHLGLINKSMVGTERQGITSEDRLCLFFPLFHMMGNTCIALAGLLRGAALIMPSEMFDPPKVLRAISQEKCTAVYGSPSMLIALIDHPEFQKEDWNTLSRGIIGGAPCPMELMRRIVKDIGVSDITVAYGITETSSWITMTHPDDPIELRVSTIGTPLSCNELKIVDPGSGEQLAADQQGELCTRGFLMKEYYKMPAATAAAIDKEDWFHTGDLGEMDRQGYVKITGRLKDVIVRDTVEIYPVEVEEIIYQLPEISEVQVFGFPHPQKEQEVAAWVKFKDGAELSLDRIARHVERHLPEEKWPRHYKIVSEFPMTGSGKIQKFKLAEMGQDEYL